MSVAPGRLGLFQGRRLHYASGMIRSVLFALLLVPGLASAVVCKTVDADGVVSYEDLPADECPQAVKLPDYSRYAPRAIEQPRAANSSATGSAVRFERYTSMEIVQPQPDATVRSNDGKVPVSIALEPALQQGHSVKLFLDGQPISGTFDALAIELAGVERGSHSLQASVVNPSGQRMIESSPVRFTLRKMGLNDIANQPEPTPRSEPPPGYVAPPKTSSGYAPPSKPDYTPPTGPGYTPQSAPTPSTPGKTNPAFAPNFNP